MRLVSMFGVRNDFDEADIAGVTIDFVTGLLAGLALVVAVWLLSSTLSAETVHVASIAAVQQVQ